MTENNYKAVFKTYAQPMIIRSVFNSFMHTADRLIAAIFIGAQALVATTLASPLMYLTFAIAALFIGGLGAYVGLLIGQKRVYTANRISSGVLVLLGVIGIVMTIPIYYFSKDLALLLGAKDQILEMTSLYIGVFSLSFPFMLVGRSLDVLIYNDESPRYSFIVNVITTTMNLTLNVIAIAILDLGIVGLAGATVLSTFFQFAAGIYYFAFKSKEIKLVKPTFDIKRILRIAYNGLSDFSMLIVDAVMVFIINRAFTQFLTPAHFEAYAAVNVLLIVFYGIFMGATMGLQPILSRSMGEMKYDYLKGMLSYSIKKTIGLGFIVYLFFIPIMDPILKLFLSDPATLELGKFFYITLGFAVLFSNLPLQTSIFFTAINRPLESALISVLRTLVFIPIIGYFSIMLIGPLGLAVGFILADMILISGLVVYMKKTDISKLKILD